VTFDAFVKSLIFRFLHKHSAVCVRAVDSQVRRSGHFISPCLENAVIRLGEQFSALLEAVILLATQMRAFDERVSSPKLHHRIQLAASGAVLVIAACKKVTITQEFLIRRSIARPRSKDFALIVVVLQFRTSITVISN